MTKVATVPRQVRGAEVQDPKPDPSDFHGIKAELAPAIARLGELSTAEVHSLNPREILFTDQRRKELARRYELPLDTKYDEIVSYVRELKNPNSLLSDLRKISQDNEPSGRVRAMEESHPPETITERIRQGRLFPEATILAGNSKQTEARLSAALFHDGVEPRFAKRITNILMGELLSVEAGAEFNITEFSAKLDKLMAGYRSKPGSDAHQIVAQFATELHAEALDLRVMRIDSGVAKLEFDQPEVLPANDDPTISLANATPSVREIYESTPDIEASDGGILSKIRSGISSARSWLKSLVNRKPSIRTVEFESLAPSNEELENKPEVRPTLSREELRAVVNQGWGRRDASETVDAASKFDYSLMLRKEGIYDPEASESELIENDLAGPEVEAPIPSEVDAPVPTDLRAALKSISNRRKALVG